MAYHMHVTALHVCSYIFSTYAMNRILNDCMIYKTAGRSSLTYEKEKRDSRWNHGCICGTHQLQIGNHSRASLFPLSIYCSLAPNTFSHMYIVCGEKQIDIPFKVERISFVMVFNFVHTYDFPLSFSSYLDRITNYKLYTLVRYHLILSLFWKTTFRKCYTLSRPNTILERLANTSWDWAE